MNCSGPNEGGVTLSTELVLPMLDAHLHLRDGDMLENVIRFSAEDVNAAIIMPNLHPNPVLLSLIHI